MLLSKSHKKPLIIISIVLASIIVIILIIQIILGNIIENKIEDAISKKENSQYIIDIGNVKVNLFTMTLILKDVNITPDSVTVQQLKQKQSKQGFALNLKIPNLRIRNIGVFSLISSKQLNIKKFIIKHAEIEILTSKHKKASKPKEKSNHKFDVDSIVIPGLNGVDIDEFIFSNFMVNVIDVSNNDTIFFAKNLDISLDNITLTKNEFDSTSFRLKISDADVNMSAEQFRLPGDKYLLTFEQMSFNMKHALLVFKNLKVKPRYSMDRMVKMSKYQYEIFNCEIKNTEIHSLYPSNIISGSGIILSNIVVDGMNLSIYKDKHYPFDTIKRPKLPVQSLKLLKQNLYIDSINIKNSELTYSELHKKMDVPMVVNLNNLNATVSNITSIVDSIAKRSVMTIKMLADLQKSIPMGVNIYMPLNSVVDTFSFNGWMGNGDMKLFNQILLPAIGLKFNAGYIDGLQFNANANTTYSIGEMTMLYHDLDGVVVRKDPEQTNKFLSWVANTAMIKNNPTPNKEKRTEPMYFNRVMYKGLGNFIWKTLQSGITATLIPTMDNKVQKDIYTAKGLDKREIKKKERQEKRKKRRSK